MPTEQVLVVKATLLNLPQTKYLTDESQIAKLLTVCQHNYLFIDRPVAELDSSYKQLIPYVTVISAGKVLCLERTNAQSETRLHGKISLGVGGHINPVDQGETLIHVISRAMARELKEELWLQTEAQPTLQGLINDNDNPVGSVHLGLHYLLHVNSKPRVRETDKMKALWLEITQLEAFRPRMETWSQILLPALASCGHL